MAFITIITVHNDNDESCRTFTLCEEINSVDHPTPESVKADIKKVHEFYRASAPHNHTLPSFLPTMIEIVPAQNRKLAAA